MSFGINDDWLDPPEPGPSPMRCDICANGRTCPCGEHCYCTEADEFYEVDDIDGICDFFECGC